MVGDLWPILGWYFVAMLLGLEKVLAREQLQGFDQMTDWCNFEWSWVGKITFHYGSFKQYCWKDVTCFWNIAGVFKKVFVIVHSFLFDPFTAVFFERFLGAVGFSIFIWFENLACLNVLIFEISILIFTSGYEFLFEIQFCLSIWRNSTKNI